MQVWLMNGGFRMATVLGRPGARASRSDRQSGDRRPQSNDGSSSGRRLLFKAGDFAFLVCVGAATTVVAHLVHQLGWTFVPTCLLGMVAAMIVQTLLAVLASPVLGSIECMVPSMFVAMASPMVVCGIHLSGQEPTRSMGIVIGTVVAVGMFVFVQWYGRSCIAMLRNDIAKASN